MGTPKGWNWIGTYYPKKKFEVKVTDTVENAIAGIIVPPNCLVNRWWARFSFAATSNSNFEDELEYVISGRIGDIATDVDLDHSDTTLDHLVGHYLPMQVDEQNTVDPDGDTDEELELSGHKEMSDIAKKMEFFHREGAIRYGHGAPIIAENGIRYHQDFNTKGRINKYCDILSPQIMAFTFRKDKGESSSDWNNVLAGGTSSINTLTEALMDNLEQGKDGVLGVMDDVTSSTLLEWLSLGYNEGSEDYEGDKDIFMKVKMTAEVRVFTPQGTKYYSGG